VDLPMDSFVALLFLVVVFGLINQDSFLALLFLMVVFGLISLLLCLVRNHFLPWPQCPSCGHTSKGELQECVQCGEKLVTCPSCGQFNKDESTKCVQCGEPLPQ